MKRSIKSASVVLSLTLIGGVLPASAAVVFSDNFDRSLLGSAWIGKDVCVAPYCTSPATLAFNGTIVADPLDISSPFNRVLAFNDLNSYGDTFTAAEFAAGTYTLSFDYLGLAKAGSVPGDLGGFIGFAYEIASGPDTGKLVGEHFWLAGTNGFGGTFNGQPVDVLIDNGVWAHHTLTFTAFSPFHLMLEDFDSSLGVPGDAYFDNLVLNAVPLPAAVWLLGSALTGLALISRRRSGPANA